MVVLVVNANSRSLQTSDAREAFVGMVARVLPQASVRFAEEGRDIERHAREAIADGATLIAAGGGDGTVNSIAGLLAGTRVILGVLPMGTLNHFAKDLGIPSDIEEAVRVLGDGRVVTVDVGEVNGRVFVNNSGLGLYPDMVHQRERWTQGASKWFAAVWEGVRALMRYRLLGVRIVVNGEKMLRRTPSIMVGNNAYALQALASPTRPRLDAGVLSLYVPHPTGRLRLVWFAIQALLWRSLPDSDFDATLTDSLIIESRRHQLRLSLDGEVTTMAPPLTYRSRAGALQVMTPKPVE